jgi:hypothetical protein
MEYSSSGAIEKERKILKAHQHRPFKLVVETQASAMIMA